MSVIKSTAQKMTFYITDFFSQCDQISSFLRIWSHLLKKFAMENFSFLQWRCPILWGSLTKIVTFGIKHFVRYLRCPLLGGFSVTLRIFNWDVTKLYSKRIASLSKSAEHSGIWVTYFISLDLIRCFSLNYNHEILRINRSVT